jgi:ParB family transcriptional regulator, chromosome partitioning protein
MNTNAIPNEDFTMSIMVGSGKALKRQAEAAGATVTDRGPVWHFKPEDITVLPGFNTRIPGPELDAHIEHLAGLMMVNGFLQDHALKGMILSVDGKQVPAAMGGHCRLAAVKLAIARGAPIDTVPFVTAPPGTTEEDMTAEIVTGNQGKPLTSYEVAIVVQRLARFNWPVSKIAERLGYSQGHVRDLLVLISAPRLVRDMIEAGQISSSVAMDTIKKHGDKALGMLVAGVSKAAAEGKVKATAKHLPEAKHEANLKSRAPTMFRVIGTVKGDPSFKRLKQETQDAIVELLELLKD